MKSTRFINPLSDEAIAYAAFAWDSGPAGARAIILSDAIQDKTLRNPVPFDVFNEYVQTFLQEQTPPAVPPAPLPPPVTPAYSPASPNYIGHYIEESKKKIPITSIIATLFGGFLCLFFYNSMFPSSTYLAPTPTITPHPTATRSRPPTVTPEPCIHWSQVTAQMNGRRVCVYGIVSAHTENWDNSLTNLYFGTREEFFFVSTYRWTDPFEGKCVSTTGEVQLNTSKIPYIKFGDTLSNCEQWISGVPPATAITRSTQTQSAGTYSGCPDGCSVHPTGCDIKGNIAFDSGEKIYHLPGQDYYANTTIDPAYGERWFCTEEEAISNGWRKAYQ